jgi:hypothetical protein
VLLFQALQWKMQSYMLILKYLLEMILMLDPKNRITVSHALQGHYLQISIPWGVASARVLSLWPFFVLSIAVTLSFAPPATANHNNDQ